MNVKKTHKWNEAIGFRGDINMRIQLEKIADREGVSISCLLRELVHNGIKSKNSKKRRALFSD